MKVLYIAHKNIKAMFQNIPFLIFLIIMPLFQVYFINMMTDTQDFAKPLYNYVEMVILNPSQNNALIQVYTSGILVQFLLIAGILAGAMVISEKENNTLARTFSTPVTRGQVLGGILSGHTINVMLITMIIIVSTHLLFDVNWGNSWFNVFVVSLFAVYVAATLAFIVSGLFKNGKLAGGVMSAVVIVMTFMSGGIIQGEQFDKISNFTINKWISEAYLKLMEGGTISDIKTNLLVLGIMGSIFLITAYIVYKKENIYE